MSSVWQDLRFALRSFARDSRFSMAVVLTLAIALGCNTAVFSIVNGVLLRALPYPDSGRIVDVSILSPPVEGRPGRREFLESQWAAQWEEGTSVFERVAVYQPQFFTLSVNGRRPIRLTGAGVSVSLFPLLQVQPAQGRIFAEEDRHLRDGRVVLLSHQFWRHQLQGDPKILGRTVILDGLPYTVIGVMGEDFFFPRRDLDLWVPLAESSTVSDGAESIAVRYLPAVARLRPGVTLERAEAETDALLRAAAGEGAPEGRIHITTLRDEIVSEVRPALVAVSVAVGLVLMIACTNVANLLLARSSARRREMAIRSALGGGRLRLVRQLLTESLVLSFAGALPGLLLAAWAHRFLPKILPGDLPQIGLIELDLRAFLFSFALAAMSGLLFGLAPALWSTGADWKGPLSPAVGRPGSWRSFRGSLVIAQVALAFVLLVGAGLLVRSFRQATGIDPGYRPEHVVTVTLDLDPERYQDPGSRSRYFDRLLSEVEARPEVEAAGVVSFPPLTPGFSMIGVKPVGLPQGRTLAVPQLTSEGYPRAIGLRLIEGRWLSRQDDAAGAPVAVVNKSFVRQHLGDQQALGQQVQAGTASLEIVGVVEDVLLLGPRAKPKPEIFTSFHQALTVTGAEPQQMTLTVRTTGDPARFIPTLRGILFNLDPELAMGDIRTMAARLTDSMAPSRFYAFMLTLFAGIALLLAATGVYGVLSYMISQQTRSIGVRRALGAQDRDILALELRKGAVLTILGLALGGVISLAATRPLADLLFEVTSRDPVSYAVAAAVLVLVTGLGAYLPARHAVRIEPLEALRQEN